MTRRLILTVAIVSFCASAGPAAAFQIHAGLIRSDVGLDQEGSGFTFGVGGQTPLGTGPFDFTGTLEYLQKRGTQPMIVSNPKLGPVRADAEVTLHCLQPAGFLGWSFPVGSLVPRLYAGASVSVKLGESWDRLEGGVATDYSYEDVDFLVHLGATLRYREFFFLDVRWSQGLMEQVVVRDGSAAKAQDPLTGARLPEDGDTVSSFQIGLGVTLNLSN